MKYELGFIGAGNMAEAIAKAAVDCNIITGDKIIASDPSDDRQKVFADIGVQVTENNDDVVSQAKQIILAIKPQMLDAVAGGLGSKLNDDQVIISIMAGVSSTKLENALGKTARIIRVMPNTPMLVGKGMAGVALGQNAKPGDESLSMKLFTAAGKAVVVEEKAIDAVTAVSGSGPAYIFYLAEAMEQAAVELGLGDASKEFACQTILGAGLLLSQSQDSAAQLRRKVTSPGGTTEAAINSLEQNNVKDAIVAAVKQAASRSVELGK